MNEFCDLVNKQLVFYDKVQVAALIAVYSYMHTPELRIIFMTPVEVCVTNRSQFL